MFTPMKIKVNEKVTMARGRLFIVLILLYFVSYASASETFEDENNLSTVIVTIDGVFYKSTMSLDNIGQHIVSTQNLLDNFPLTINCDSDTAAATATEKSKTTYNLERTVCMKKEKLERLEVVSN